MVVVGHGLDEVGGRAQRLWDVEFCRVRARYSAVASPSLRAAASKSESKLATLASCCWTAKSTQQSGSFRPTSARSCANRLGAFSATCLEQALCTGMVSVAAVQLQRSLTLRRRFDSTR